MTAEKQNGYDYFILATTIILLGLGLVTVYSSSSFLAEHRLGDSNFYLKRQLAFCLFGICSLIVVKNIPVTFYQKMVYPLLGISFILLVMLFIPGFGKKVGGAYRWLGVGGFTVQPSELAKLSLAVYMAYSMSKKGQSMSQFSKGFMPHLIIVGIFMLLILLQPDLGTTVILGCWLIILLFVGGLNLLQLLVAIAVSAPAIWWLISREAYRMDRWTAFINPWEDPTGLGFQIIHSFLAFGSGGINGVGLGNSIQKLFYLPEPHTDFIFSVLAEELGLVGVTAVVLLFAMLVFRGIKIALDAGNLYSSYLAFAISTLIGLQVLINMGVVMGLLPTKGLTLPLISYGGSSLVVNLIGIGMLLRISSDK